MGGKLEIVWNTNLDASGYSSCARSYIHALHKNPRASVNVLVNNVAKNINALGLDRKDLLFFSEISPTRRTSTPAAVKPASSADSNM